MHPDDESWIGGLRSWFMGLGAFREVAEDGSLFEIVAVNLFSANVQCWITLVGGCYMKLAFGKLM